MKQRVNYDKIAKLYDADHHRGKQAGPDFLTFLAERGHREANTLASLDIGRRNAVNGNWRLVAQTLWIFKSQRVFEFDNNYSLH